MTTFDTPIRNTSVPDRLRTWAAALLPVGPAFMLLEQATTNDQDPRGWSVFFGLLSVPFLLVTIAVAAAACWRATPKVSAVALAAVIGNVIGLAALHGIEAYQVLLTNAGVGRATTDAALDAFTSLPVGQLEVVLFFGGNLIGSVALIWAQFRTRTLPWHVPVINVLAVVADFTIPDEASPMVKSAGTALFVLWSVTLALAIRRPAERTPLRGRRPVAGRTSLTND